MENGPRDTNLDCARVTLRLAPFRTSAYRGATLETIEKVVLDLLMNIYVVVQFRMNVCLAV